MKRKIIHLIRKVDFKDGWTSNGTLCQKMQWQGGEAVDGGGNNVTTNSKEVTCKLCLKHRKFPKSEDSR